jgi:hypothetical protein
MRIAEVEEAGVRVISVPLDSEGMSRVLVRFDLSSFSSPSLPWRRRPRH